MGMPITVAIVDSLVVQGDIDEIFCYFVAIDERFSTYKPTSEIAKINRGELAREAYSVEMKEILSLCEQTKKETNGYFDMLHNSVYDPSGLVKGWAIQKASEQLHKKGFKNFYIDAGGDMQTSGRNEKGEAWNVGIRNPFHREEHVKILSIEGLAVATSGTYIRGEHIYNPHQEGLLQTSVVSLTVIGPTIYDADRFATAAFAMGEKGISFIASVSGFEGYMIDATGKATYTSGFEQYVLY